MLGLDYGDGKGGLVSAFVGQGKSSERKRVCCPQVFDVNII